MAVSFCFPTGRPRPTCWNGPIGCHEGQSGPLSLALLAARSLTQR